jgi:plasmid rolling circle replication initiator protein Rep
VVIGPSSTSQSHEEPEPTSTEGSPLQPAPYYARGLKLIDRVYFYYSKLVVALIGQKRASRFFTCGTKLWFLKDPRTGRLHLKHGWFCGFPFCPICSHHRRGQVERRMKVATKLAVQAKPTCRFIEILFTVKNCPLEDLRRWADALNSGFSRMTKMKGWPGIGAARGLEIKRAEDDLAHPHLHGVILVGPGYFNGQNYLGKEKWQAMWKQAMGLEYDPHVGTSNIKEGEEGAEEAAEIMGYSQEDETDDEDEIIGKIRAWKETYGIKRLQTYGLLKKLMPPSAVKVDPVVEAQMRAKNLLAEGIRFTWRDGAFEAGTWSMGIDGR